MRRPKINYKMFLNLKDEPGNYTPVTGLHQKQLNQGHARTDRRQSDPQGYLRTMDSEQRSDSKLKQRGNQERRTELQYSKSTKKSDRMNLLQNLELIKRQERFEAALQNSHNNSYLTVPYTGYNPASYSTLQKQSLALSPLSIPQTSTYELPSATSLGEDTLTSQRQQIWIGQVNKKLSLPLVHDNVRNIIQEYQDTQKIRKNQQQIKFRLPEMRSRHHHLGIESQIIAKTNALTPERFDSVDSQVNEFTKNLLLDVPSETTLQPKLTMATPGHSKLDYPSGILTSQRSRSVLREGAYSSNIMSLIERGAQKRAALTRDVSKLENLEIPSTLDLTKAGYSLQQDQIKVSDESNIKHPILMKQVQSVIEQAPPIKMNVPFQDTLTKRSQSVTKRATRNSSKCLLPNYVNWEQEYKSTFPLQKLEIIQKMTVADGIFIRNQIDSIIDKKRPAGLYNFEQSSHRFIEKTVNFGAKLGEIDAVIKKELIDGTLDSIIPTYKYIKDPILEKGAKRRKLVNVNDVQIRDNLRTIKHIHDHQGRILTMNGSKYDNFGHQMEIMKIKSKRKAKSTLRRQPSVLYMSKQNSSSSFGKTGKGSSPPFNSGKQSESQSIFHTMNSSKKVSLGTKTQDQGFKLSMIQSLDKYLQDRVSQALEKAQLPFLKLAKKYRKELQRQLDHDGILDQLQHRTMHSEEDAEVDLEYLLARIPDEVFEKRLFSSQYNDAFKAIIEQSKAVEVDNHIASTISGRDTSHKKAIRNDTRIAKRLEQIKDKLNHIEQNAKALDIVTKDKKGKKVSKKKQNSQAINIIDSGIQNSEETVRLNLKTDQFATQYGKKFETTIEQAIDYFMLECAKANVTAPILNKKIVNRRLEFRREVLSIGACMALAVSISLFVPKFFDSIILDDNMLEDSALSIILEELVKVGQLKRLFLLSNTLGPLSLLQISKLSLMPYPSNLQELVLNRCKIGKEFIDSFIQSIKGKCQLRVLGLSQQHFEIGAVEGLAKLIQENSSLENLDISYCRFYKPHALNDLIKSISNGRNSIVNLNLSFNPVQEGVRQDFSEAMRQFIKSSMTLTHLNLSACGISVHSYVMKIFEGVKKSKTLQSIHFSGNSLDEETTVNDIRRLLRVCRVERDSHKHLFTEAERIDQEVKYRNEQKGSTSPRRIPLKQKMKSKTILEIGIPQINCNREEAHIVQGDQYVFSRYLGHLEIQNSFRWVERTTCWICNKWQYLMLIWSGIVGDHLYSSQPPSQFFSESEDAPNQSANEPILIAPDRSVKKMLIMSEFIDLLDQNTEPHQRFVNKVDESQRKQALEMGKAIQKQQRHSYIVSLSRYYQEVSQSHANEHHHHRLLQEHQQQEEWQNVFKVNKEWPSILSRKILAIKEVVFAAPIDEIMQLKPKPDELYFAYADFVPPNRLPQQYAVQFGQIRPNKVYFKQLEIQPRKFPIKTAFKRTKKTKIERYFNLRQSVFSQWAVPLDKEYRKCFEADMKFSKIQKFIKPETAAFREISDTILRNYAQIYEVYLYCSGKSNYPSIQWIDFTDMCADAWKIIDKNLTLSTVDRLFIAVNFEGVPDGGLEDNPDKELCRYEFFEILVRMAVAKFPHTPPHEALQTLLADYIFNDPGLLSWSVFRQELLWIIEIDDIYKANTLQMKKLYQSVLTITKKQFKLSDALKMVHNCSGLRLNDKEATLAFAYSKFPVTDEMQDIDQLEILTFGEFQEFVARLAQIRHPDPQMATKDKIILVMIELFKLIGMQLTIPQHANVGDSESDYEDFKGEDDEENDYYY